LGFKDSLSAIDSDSVDEIKVRQRTATS